MRLEYGKAELHLYQKRLNLKIVLYVAGSRAQIILIINFYEGKTIFEVIIWTFMAVCEIPEKIQVK